MAKNKYALISVYNKTNIIPFAQRLHKLGYSIISTGGTAKTLSESNIPVIPIQEITRNPESFDGRMKTISFQIESGILFDRSNKKHVEEAKKLRIAPIDIVICNLYPFEETIQKKDATLDDAIENIDVGGPTMVRSAAKNFKHVIVVIDPADYERVADAISQKNIPFELRQQLAAKAFSHLSYYDSQIARFFSKELFPETTTIPLKKTMDLRYGENPHQKATVYLEPLTKTPFRNLKKMWGRDLSLTNVTDLNAGIESVRFFQEPTAVVIKHNSPCGIALGKDQSEALQRAIKADPLSAFGGIIVVNRPIDMQTAKIIASFKDEKKGNIDILAGPSIEKDAFELLQHVRKSMGIYTFGSLEIQKNRMNIKWIDGGLILQTSDDDIEQSFSAWKIATKKQPSKQQIKQMQIAWKFISRIKSNTILVVDKEIPMTLGIGAGQTSRIGSAKIALEQAGKYCKGAIFASDSFFPFDDTVKLAAQYGIAAIIQQGGSVNDATSIQAADAAGIPMVFTGRRAFWH